MIMLADRHCLFVIKLICLFVFITEEVLLRKGKWTDKFVSIIYYAQTIFIIIIVYVRYLFIIEDKLRKGKWTDIVYLFF